MSRFNTSGLNYEGRQWRVSSAILTLANQITIDFPDREPADGTVASRQHDLNSPNSDHRPSPHAAQTGAIVRAIDIGGGEEVDAMLESIRLSRDSRVKYAIRFGRIFSSYAVGNRPAWQWGPYSGDNPHNTHGHLSVLSGADHDARLWEIGDDDLALLTDDEQLQLKRFLANIAAENSDVSFVTQAIQDVRERNIRGMPAKESHSHPVPAPVDPVARANATVAKTEAARANTRLDNLKKAI